MSGSGKFNLGNYTGARLTPEQVIEMRRLYAEERWTQGALSRHFQVSVGQVGRIVRGESWQRYTRIPHERELEDRFAIAPPVDQTELAASLARLSEKLDIPLAPQPEPPAEDYAAGLKKLAEQARARRGLGETQEETRDDSKDTDNAGGSSAAGGEEDTRK